MNITSILKEDRHYKYKITSRPIRVTTVAVE